MTFYLKSAAAIAAAFIAFTPMAQAELIALDATNFPDANFISNLKLKNKSAITGDNIDTDKVTAIDLSYGDGPKVTDLTGIKLFTKLQTLTTNKKCLFETLDVSGLTELKTISNGTTHSTSVNAGPSTSVLNSHKGNIKYLYANGCTALNTLHLPFTQSLEVVEINNTGNITSFDVSHSNVRSIDLSGNILGNINSGATLLLHQMTELRSIKLGYQPYMKNIQVQGKSTQPSKLKFIDLSGCTWEYNEATQMTISLNYNRLENIIFPKLVPDNSLANFYYSDNAFVFLPDLNRPKNDPDRFGIQNASPSTSQKRYVGKGVSKVFIAYGSEWTTQHRVTKNTNCTIKKEADGNYWATLSGTPSTTAKHSYTITIPYYSKTANMTVTLIQDDDPDFADVEPRELRIVEAGELTGESQSILDEGHNSYIPMVYQGNGTYSYKYEDHVMAGNFRIEAHNGTAARSGESTLEADFGGIDSEDINPADSYVCVESDKFYTMSDGSEKSFTTHPKQNEYNSTDASTSTYRKGYENPTVTVRYLPEFNIAKLSIAQPTPPVTTGIDNVAEEGADLNAEPEYFNLQGVRVSAEGLTPGIYIRRTGAHTEKVAIR